MRRVLLVLLAAAALVFIGFGCGGPEGPKGYIEVINDLSSSHSIIEISHGPNSQPTLPIISVNIPPGGSRTLTVDADVEWVVIVYWSCWYSDLQTTTAAEGQTEQLTFTDLCF